MKNTSRYPYCNTTLLGAGKGGGTVVKQSRTQIVFPLLGNKTERMGPSRELLNDSGSGLTRGWWSAKME